MHGNFLTYREYADLCAKFGEERPDAQSDLAGIPHALGLALYFGKDPRLHDTRVLNPGWVTGGVYAVVRPHRWRGPTASSAPLICPVFWPGRRNRKS